MASERIKKDNSGVAASPTTVKTLSLIFVREALVYLLRDAQDVQKELSFFEQFIASGLPVSESVCPLLSQVWRGDMYGCEGIRGLSELVKDLNTQLERIDRHFLMTQVLRLVDRKG